MRAVANHVNDAVAEGKCDSHSDTDHANKSRNKNNASGVSCLSDGNIELILDTFFAPAGWLGTSLEYLIL